MGNSFGCGPSVSVILCEVAAATESKGPYIARSFERFDNTVHQVLTVSKRGIAQVRGGGKENAGVQEAAKNPLRPGYLRQGDSTTAITYRVMRILIRFEATVPRSRDQNGTSGGILKTFLA